MSAKPDWWMPLYIADYLADTQDLDPEQHGAYLLLLMTAWMRGGRLPNDDRKLANIARCNPAQWKRIKPDVIGYFTEEGDDLVQRRLIEEYARAVKTHEAQKKNGAKGGRPPKVKTQTEPMGFDSLNPRANPNHNPNETPIPIPTQEHESTNVDSSAGKPANPACPQQAIIELYHETLPELRRVRVWAGARPKALASRWRESADRQSLDWWGKYFGYVRKSKFLMGQTTGRDGRGFDCDLEWLIRPANFAKVIEGKYEDVQ